MNEFIITEDFPDNLIKGIDSVNCRFVSASEDSEGYSLLRLAKTISEMVVR